MTKAPTPVALNDSRLVRLLTELIALDVDLSHQDFSQKLGQLLTFSDSITLSGMYEKLSRLQFQPDTALQASAAKNEFLRVRQLLMGFIVKSFAEGDALVRVRYPAPPESGIAGMDLSEKDQQALYESYRVFYVSHQREMDLKLQTLSAAIRKLMSGLSDDLAKLSLLDKTMSEMLAPHKRKFFSAVPALMGKRFEHLLQEQHQLQLAIKRNEEQIDKEKNDGANSRVQDPVETAAIPNWYPKLRGEIQQLLLAELDIRLQPALGLVEAIADDPVVKERLLKENHQEAVI